VITVLLTDGEFTGLIRTLREAYSEDIRIVGLSTDPYTPHQAILDAFYVVPSHDDPEYFDELIRITQAEKADIIFPIVSEGLESIMQNEARIRKETGARILSSPLQTVCTANDKGLLYAYLHESHDEVLSGLVPSFCTADTKHALFGAVRTIEALGKKACIKKRRGEDADGFWVIDNEADYPSLLFFESPRRILSEKILTEILAGIDDDDTIPPYLVTEYLPGEEWDCDVLCLDGRLISVTARINLNMTGGLTSVLEVRDNPLLVSFCDRIVNALHLSYVCCISFRADSEGNFFLLEINPRMMGNIYVSALAGNNYAKMAIDLLSGQPVYPVQPKTGITTALYYDQLSITPPQIKK